MSSLKTENLVILFTDIAGYTESTSLQSREQNQRILDRHNALLLPIVKRFRGRHVKSIGDALLLAFTSPTDGMRCAMAMQDAMHGYNLTAPPGEEIHIRIAASLGEVRVTKSDIFGEPVNVTSRIEGITPVDEIYFSEAVYLAMNKAEVPAVEVGLKELKGISKPVRIFAIPRFTQTRLVPEHTSSVAVDPRVSFPYGGMHLTGAPQKKPWAQIVASEASQLAFTKQGVATIAVGAGLLAVVSYISLRPKDSPLQSSGAAAPTLKVTSSPTPFSPTAAPANAPAAPIPFEVVATLVPTLQSLPSAAAQIAATAPLGASIDTIVRPTPTVVQPLESKSLPKVRAQLPKPAPPKPPSITTIVGAKMAYRERRITKAEYKQIVNRLEEQLDAQVRQAKLDYKAGRISKDEARHRIQALKLRYIGAD